MVEIEEVESESKQKAKTDQTNVEKYNELMSQMSKAREEMAEEEANDEDHLLMQAINLAIEQGRGWGPGEKEAYLEKILDDDWIPPLFATTPEEVEKSGLSEAFTSLIYDGESATSLMLQFRKKGNDSFANGKRNQVRNVQYFRDAINFWYEALAWALKIEPLQEGDLAQADTDDPTYNPQQLDEIKGVICSNLALAHMMLGNWGHCRDEAKKAVELDPNNVKGWYRLAKAHQMLKNWEAAGDAIDAGLAVKGEEQNKDLLKLQRLLADRILRARKLRQQRERKRAERVSRVKRVWKHCQTWGIQLGKVPLVASVTEEDDDDAKESRWHNHLPHSGMLPTCSNQDDTEWSWPCLFVYPSHNQSDFIANFGENEMIAMRMAEVFPELEDGAETAMPWDTENQFTCSNLAVYFEVHESALEQTNMNTVVHPESVQLIKDQGSCMRFYESSRALKGDEGEEIAEVIRLVERKQLSKQEKAWKMKHGSLWALPDPSPVVRVHPAMTLRQVLQHAKMVVPNFLVTLMFFPENHPAHEQFLREHKCIEILQPDPQQKS